MISHHGQHLGAGHYTCDVRRRLGSTTAEGPESTSGSNSGSKSEGKCEWYHCDDSNVRRVPLSDVLSRQAYVLFYERVPAAGAS